jgi:hypothetical protein
VPSELLVVKRVALQTVVEDADEPVGEGAEGVVAGACSLWCWRLDLNWATADVTAGTCSSCSPQPQYDGLPGMPFRAPADT